MARSTTINTTVRGYRMEIIFDYTPASKGERERGTGLQLSPDEPAEIEIIGVTLCDPSDIWEIISEEVTITTGDLIEAVQKWEP
jgi:hypothetical protein